MYFVKYGSKYLHEPRVDGLVLTDLSFEGRENEASLCSFEISSTHPLYDELVERASTKFVKVFDSALGEDDSYFVGYIYEMSDEFNRQRTVKCKGELAFFNDSIVRPYTTQGSVEVDADPSLYFEWLVDEHNKQVEAAKEFSVGHVQAGGLDLNGYILRADSTYPTTGEAIKSKLLDSLGGVLNVRYENGKRYVDYLTEWSDVNVQVFDFGVNLTDFTKTDDALDVATFVVPVGANMKDTAYDYDDGYFKTSDSKPVKDKEYFVRSFKKCGAMTAFTDGVTYWEKKETDYFKTSDAKPFSGVDYYCKAFTKVNISKFASGKTYYRLIDGVYTKVTGSYNKNYTYYTMKWEKQSVSKFDEDKTYWEKETYYAKTSDSAPKSGKDYYTLNRGSYSSKKDLGRFLKHETYYEYKKANDESERRLTIEALADIQYDADIVKRGDLVYSESAVEKYGWIGAVYEDTDIKLRNNLLDAGVLALKEAVSPATTIEVKAVDLSLVNPEYKPIRVGEYVRVRSKPHGFDSYMLCTGVKLDLNNPQNSEYTLGTVFDKLSGQQNKRIKALNKTIDKVYEKAEAISAEAKAEAIEAIEEAKKAQTEAMVANDSVLLAQENIDEAVAEAVEAKEQADAVQALADVAVADAAAAKSVAEAAQAAADEAKANLAEAEEELASVKSRVGVTEQDIATAEQAVAAAKKAADDAQADADAAASAASAAQGTANTAVANAKTAQEAANAAQSAADKAQSDVSALATRVTTTEAGIKNLNDSISLYAKKTEVAETLSGYSTTEQMNAAIDLKAEGITQSVSQTYQTKDAMSGYSTTAQMNSAIEQTAESISLAVAREAVDELGFGDKMSEAFSQIAQLADSIQSLVVDADGASMMEQTDTGWKFSMASVLEGIKANADAADSVKADLDGKYAELKNQLADIGAYVTISQSDGVPYIELGNQGDFKVRITNGDMQFRYKDVWLTKLDFEKLIIKKADVTEELSVGGLVVAKRGNGNVGFTWREE